MDYDLQFDRKHRILVIVMGKTVTEGSSSAAQKAVRRFLASEGPCSIIADLSKIEIERVPGTFVRSLAWAPSMLAPGSCLILVAPQTVIYGLSRMFHLWRREAPSVRIVRTLEEGYTLLGLETPGSQAIDQLVASAGAPAA